jgi:FtsH-binding integral membrane protein
MRIRSQRDSARGTVGHAYSALNLRLLLASFGLVSCAVLAVVSARVGLPALAVVLAVLAVVAAVDLIVIQRRRMARRRAEPDVRHSLFE